MDNYRFVFRDENNESVGEVKNSSLVIYKDIKKQLEGNIYRARVDTYIKSMDAYILNIGEYKNAILKRKNIISDFKLGDDILVEVIFVPENEKMIEVTQSYSISDGYIVLLPFTKSKNSKIKNDLEIPYTLRTRSEELTQDEILNKYNKLVEIFKDIQNEKNKLPTPKLLRSGKYLNNFCLDYDGEILSNFKFEFSTIVDKRFNPIYNEEISKSITNITNRKIEIGNASIYIDKLEALTVIDVNSGATNMNLVKEEMSISINLKVIEEIAIQISLRNIKKMLIIDFIRVNKTNKELIIQKLREQLVEYNIKANILGFSRLGLLEIVVY